MGTIDFAAFILEMQHKGFIPFRTLNPNDVRDHLQSGFGMVIDNPICGGAIQDCSFLWLTPRIIFRPRTESQLRTIIQICQKQQIPLTFAGGKTGLSGGYSNFAVIVDLEALQTLQPPIQMYSEKGIVTVDQSVLVADLISGIPYHTKNRWIFPIQPSSAFKLPVRIGGLIGTNASGVMSGKLGAAMDWIEELKVMFPSGNVHSIKPSDPRFKNIIGGNGRFGVVLSALFRLYQIEPNLQYHVLYGKELDSVLKGLQLVQDRKIIPLVNEFILSEHPISGKFQNILGFKTIVHWIILLRGSIKDLKEFESILSQFEKYSMKTVQKTEFSALMEERTALATKTMEDDSTLSKESLVLFPGFEDILMQPNQIITVLRELNNIFHDHGLPLMQIGYGHLNFRKGTGLLLHVRLPLPESLLYAETHGNKQKIANILTEVIWTLIEKYHSLPKAEHTLGAFLVWYDAEYRETLRNKIQSGDAFYNPHLMIFDYLRDQNLPHPSEPIHEPSKVILGQLLQFYLNPHSNIS